MNTAGSEEGRDSDDSTTTSTPVVVIDGEEGPCSDLDLVSKPPAPRLSQHMISMFETFRSHMDLNALSNRRSSNTDNEATPGPGASELHLTEDEGDDEGPQGNLLMQNHDDKEITIVSPKCSKSLHSAASRISNQVASLMSQTKTKPQDTDTGDEEEDGYGCTTHLSLSSISEYGQHFQPSRTKVGEVWKYAGELLDDDESEEKKNPSKSHTSVLTEEIKMVGDTATDQDFPQEKPKESKEIFDNYNPFETPKKQTKFLPMIPKDDYYYQSSSSEESDIEILIKIPKSAFVGPALNELAQACPSCRVVGVKKKHGSPDYNKLVNVPKAFTNILGEKTANFPSITREFITANLEEDGRGGKSVNFASLHSKFDPARKRKPCRHTSETLVNLEDNTDGPVSTLRPFTGDKKANEQQFLTATISKTPTDSKAELNSNSTNSKPQANRSTTDEGNRTERLGRAATTALGSSRVSASDSGLDEAGTSNGNSRSRREISSARQTGSGKSLQIVVDSWRNSSSQESPESPHHRVNRVEHCKIILDKPAANIFGNWVTQKRIEATLKSPLFKNQGKVTKECGGKKDSKRLKMPRKRHTSEEAGDFQCRFSAGTNAQRLKVKGKTDDCSSTSSSCFSFPEDSDADGYDVPISIKEGEFPFLTTEELQNEAELKAHSGVDNNCQELCGRTEESFHRVVAHPISGLNSTVVEKSSRVYSVGASLPPKPSAVRCSKAVNLSVPSRAKCRQGLLRYQEDKLPRKTSSSTMSLGSQAAGQSSDFESDVNSNWTASKPVNAEAFVIDLSRPQKPSGFLKAAVQKRRRWYFLIANCCIKSKPRTRKKYSKLLPTAKVDSHE